MVVVVVVARDVVARVVAVFGELFVSRGVGCGLVVGFFFVVLRGEGV